jgi:hypothetical protein
MTLESKQIKSEKDAYKIGNQKYPRMTHVLDIISKPEFYRWYSKHGYDKCQKIMNDRAAYGTRFHTEMENMITGKEVWYDNDEMKIALEMARDWVSEHKIDTIRTEETLYDDFLQLAGTADAQVYAENIPKFDNKRVKLLLDWKTSKRVYDSYELQVAGYMYMAEKIHDTTFDGCGVVAFRDGKVHEKYWTREEALKKLPILISAIICFRWKFGYKWDIETEPYLHLLELID